MAIRNNFAYVNLVAQSEYLNRSPGGISRYCYEQTKNIARHVPKHMKVQITGIKRGPGPLGILSTKIMGLHFKPNSKIIHNLTEMPLIPSNKNNAVLINTAHEFQRILYPEITKTEGRMLSEIPEYLIKKNYMWDILKGDCMIATSSQTKKEAQKLGFDNKIFVVNPGVSAEFLHLPKHVSKKREFIVGYIGAIRKRKGIKMLIDSMAHLDRGVKLRMYGEIFDRFRRDFDGIMKTAKNAEYCGVAPRSKIVRIYDGFDAFVMPSVYEGFGMGILEAQARGIPVIINGRGKLPYETSRHCFKANDALHISEILQHIKDNGYNARLRKTAISYAKRFTWKRTAEETIKVYESLVC